MSSNLLVHGSSVAEAWSRLFLELMRPGVDSLPATMVKIERPTAAMVEQRHPIIAELNALLRGADKPVVRESAAIIFPYSQWKAKGWHIEQLTRWYLDQFMPRLIAVSRRHARTYFHRLIDFTGIKLVDGAAHPIAVNQLAENIQLCRSAALRGTHFRESGLQMALFDPAKDLTASARSNFPCLHQIGLGFDSSGSLRLSAFYPAQFVVERGFGNYLGLCQLGLFIASELGIPFAQFVCFIATPQRGGFSKGSLRGLDRTAAAIVAEADNHSEVVP